MRCPRWLALLPFALVLAGPVRADFITFGPQPYTIGLGQTIELHFPQFDPALGTLDPFQGVAWFHTQHIEGQTVTYDNETAARLQAELMVGALARGRPPGVNPAGIALGGLVRFNRTLEADDEPGEPPDFAGFDSVQLTNPGVTPITGGTVPLMDSFPLYVGTGTVLFTINDYEVLPPNFPLLAPHRVDEPGLITGTVTLQYEFTPAVAVPEPATVVLLSLAVLAGAGVGLLRHRRGDGPPAAV